MEIREKEVESGLINQISDLLILFILDFVQTLK